MLKINYTFMRRNWSNYLVEYANKKALKLKAYRSERRILVNVTFMDEINSRVVMVDIDLDGKKFSSKSITDDYFDAIDSTFKDILLKMDMNSSKPKNEGRKSNKNPKSMTTARTVRSKAA